MIRSASRKEPRTMAKAKRNAAKPRKREKQIHVLTDGTGGLPRHTLAVLLSQFPELKKPPKYHVFCSSVDKIEQVFADEIKRSSIVFHSLTDPKAKVAVTELAEAKRCPTFDLTGAVVEFLAKASGTEPINDFDLVHAQTSDYFDRIDAWEYTMQHDDSRRLDSIDKAEVVLLGISRVSKTPTSAYLGWLGHKVANVSFAPECGIPKEIKKCKRKVIALTMQPKQLSEIRSRRMQVNGFADVLADDPNGEIRYAGLRDTIRECMRAERVYRDLGVPVIDVTDSTVEETAARVIELMAGKKRRARSPKKKVQK